VFLASFIVYFAFGYACFMCICFKTAIWLFLAFLGQSLAFLVKTGWQPSSLLHPCIQDASGQGDAAEQIAADRLPQFSSVRIPVEYCSRVTRCLISSSVTTGLWSRSGYRRDRISETKGNALA